MMYTPSPGETAWNELDFNSYRPGDFDSEAKRFQFRKKVAVKLKKLIEDNQNPDFGEAEEQCRGFCNLAWGTVKSFENVYQIKADALLQDLPRRIRSDTEKGLDDMIENAEVWGSRIVATVTIPAFLGGAILGGWLAHKSGSNALAYCGAAISGLAGAIGTVLGIYKIEELYKNSLRKERNAQKEVYDALFLKSVQKYLERNN